MALSAVSATFTIGMNWTGQQNLPASTPSLAPVKEGDQRQKQQKYGTGSGAGQATEIIVAFVTIAAGGSATFSLQSFTDALQYSATATKLKAIGLLLLSAADDATNGTAAASVTVGNAPTNPHPLWNDSPSTTFTIVSGQPIGTSRPDAAGIPVTPSQQNIKFVNNDLVNAAAVQVTALLA